MVKNTTSHRLARIDESRVRSLKADAKKRHGWWQPSQTDNIACPYLSWVPIGILLSRLHSARIESSEKASAEVRSSPADK